MEIAKLALTLGNDQREFLYRKGTIDEAVIMQALTRGAYDIGQLRRGGEFLALYEQLTQSNTPALILDAAAEIGAAAIFFSYKFPKARIVAVEQDSAKFELLCANTADLPVECIQATIPANAETTTPVTTISDIYNKMPDTQPFIVKFDVEAGDPFAYHSGWVERTPMIIGMLRDYLLPGTPASRRLVEYAAGWSRDFVFLHDNVFLVNRSPSLISATA